jgi:hypothetical protein
MAEPSNRPEPSLRPLADRLPARSGDATAARLFAAVEQGIDELVRAAGRRPQDR